MVLIEGLDPDHAFVMIPVEDLIADRMGQFASGTVPEMLEQARVLFLLNPDLDLPYCYTRIRHETGNEHGIENLR